MKRNMLAIPEDGVSVRQFFPSLLNPVHGADVESHEANQQHAVAGASALMGPHGHALCDHARFEDANASREWNSAKGPQLLVRWLARHCMSPTVSAIVSRLARIGSKVAYWLDRGTQPTSGGMHLALPPPRRPDQIAHAERDGGAHSDSLRLCDGLAGSAGLSAAGLVVCAKRPR